MGLKLPFLFQGLPLAYTLASMVGLGEGGRVSRSGHERQVGHVLWACSPLSQPPELGRSRDWGRSSHWGILAYAGWQILKSGFMRLGRGSLRPHPRSSMTDGFSLFLCCCQLRTWGFLPCFWVFCLACPRAGMTFLFYWSKWKLRVSQANQSQGLAWLYHLQDQWLRTNPLVSLNRGLFSKNGIYLMPLPSWMVCRLSKIMSHRWFSWWLFKADSQ